MKLTPLMTMHADMKGSVPVGKGPHGNRIIADVSGGYFEGEKLKGEVLASGADWVTLDSEGVGHLVDVALGDILEVDSGGAATLNQLAGFPKDGTGLTAGKLIVGEVTETPPGAAITGSPTIFFNGLSELIAP